MSEPASESNSPKPISTGGKPSATAPAAPPPQEFDMLVFWIQYRKVIMGVVYAVILGLVLWSIYLFMEVRKKEGSELALASAVSIDDLRKVTTEWPKTPSAATAQFRIANELRVAGKFDEAATEYRNFAQSNPAHPLLVASVAALANTLESAGKQDEALAAYKQIQTNHPKSGHVQMATLGVARILAAKGKNDEAIAMLDSIVQAANPFARNSFVEEALELQQALKNPNARKTGGTPRPAPAPAPAPAAEPTPGAPNTPVPQLRLTPPTAPGLELAPPPVPAAPLVLETPVAPPAPAGEPAKPSDTPKTPEPPK